MALKDYAEYKDQELLTLIKRGESTAFDEIYKRYWFRLYTYARNILNDQNTCEDIVQDIFTSLYLKRHELFITNLKSYLFQAVKFQVAKHLRRNQLSQNHISRMNTIRFANQTEELIHLQELETSLQESLSELPERCRQIFHMSRREHLSHDQIAERLNISKQTVKNQITKVLNHLRTKLHYPAGLILAAFRFLG